MSLGMLILFLVILLCLFCVGGGYLYLLNLRSKLRAEVKSKLEELQTLVIAFEQRMGLVERHSLPYANALRKELSGNVPEIKKIITSKRKVLVDVEGLLLQGSIENLGKAKNKLNRELPPGYAFLPEHWSRRIEDCIQDVGSKVLEASRSLRRLSGEPSGKKRTTTDLNLEKAGVVSAIRGKKRGLH